jgi:hypothetical protein
VIVQHLLFDRCVAVEFSNLISQNLRAKFGSVFFFYSRKFGSVLSRLLDGGLLMEKSMM